MGLAASRIAISGNYMLRRPKRSKNEVVAPEEEDMLLVCNACFRGFRHSVSGWVDYGT
jgi:hypothetical protein